MTRMFHAACHDLGLINEALGLDPDDGGAAPILDAIAELKGRAISANETGAEGAAIAWMRVDDPRDCISDAKKRDMIEHAGSPGARLAENYSIPLGRLGAPSATAAAAPLARKTRNPHRGGTPAYLATEHFNEGWNACLDEIAAYNECVVAEGTAAAQPAAASADERAECIAWANANGFTKYHESMCAAWEERARRATSAKQAAAALPQSVLDALRFYANGSHFNIDNDHQDFDTVSGEPVNWLYSTRDDDTTMIEDGSIAKAALCGKPLAFEDPETPVEGEVFGAQVVTSANETGAEGAKPVAWFIDWPDEPELGHYFAEEPCDPKYGRSRALGFIESCSPAMAAGAPADERAAWNNARDSLAVAMSGFASRSGNRDFNAAIGVLDAITEPGLPLAWLRTARAAAASPAAEDDNSITLDRRDLFDFVRGAIKSTLQDYKAGEGMTPSWYWQEATNRTEAVLEALDTKSPYIEAAPQPAQADAPAETREPHTYASTQATNCARCGEHKHTPLRIDWMGGYVCLTCIDRELESRAPADAGEAVGAVLISKPGDSVTGISFMSLNEHGRKTLGKGKHLLYAAPSTSMVARLTDDQKASCAVAADFAEANGLPGIAKDLRALFNGADHDQ
ncbi:hypothetical protein WK64_07645 [Burkholderia ubonensis]|nr:hypothetical protein WK64_07645 [Burkholderia ubonensis]